MQFLLDDMVLHDDSLSKGIASKLGNTDNFRDNWVKSQQVSTYGSKPIDLMQVIGGLKHAYSPEQAENTAKYLIAMAKHGQYIRDNALTLFSPLLNNSERQVEVKHSGLISNWHASDISDYVQIKIEAVERLLDGFAVFMPTDDSDSYRYYKLVDERIHPEFTGNPQNSTLLRAMWLAKRSYLTERVNVMYSADLYTADGIAKLQLFAPRGQVKPSLANALADLISDYNTYKVDISRMKKYRYDLLRDQANYVSSYDQQRRAEASRKFASFWDGMKNRQIVATPSQAAEEWLTIPMAPAGSATDRTWGIEIETVRANETSRPNGWDSRYDGSLPSGDDDPYCDCGCDTCYDASDNSDHCQDSNENCYMDDSASYSSREFVSPILHNFNSTGLKKLCDDLGTDPDEDHRAGIHVHVGAGDLTVFDVTRLLVAYSAVERLIDPLLHRKERTYCKSTTSDTLRWWLGKMREYRHMNPDSTPDVKDLIYRDSQSAPLGRYTDVNLHALSAHGTIEFRSMGAWYDYGHLARWAWFCREMVNVSKLGIDQSEWTSCQSITDVVNLLRKYGSELPSNELFDNISGELSESLEV